MNKLTNVLDAQRQSEGLTSEAFAKKLGVSQSMLVLIYQGKRRVGLKLLQAILRIYPEMSFVVHEYIAGGDGKE